MAMIVLTFIGSTPGQAQYGLDTITERYKCQNDDGSQVTADAVLASDDPSVPQMTEVHPDYEFMFVTGRHCDETGDKAAALDITYMGCIRGDGAPALPSTQSTNNTAVQSATSKISTSGLTSQTGITVEFYAPVSSISYISYIDPGGTSPPDPTGDPQVIELLMGETPFSPTTFFTGDIVGAFFVEQTLETTTSQEIVAGQFWQNTSTKTKAYAPFVFNFPPGTYVVLQSGGSNYTPGDVITVAGGGGSGTVTVTAIINTAIPGQIWGIGSQSGSWSTNATGIAGSGGSGSGALFATVVVT